MILFFFVILMFIEYFRTLRLIPLDTRRVIGLGDQLAPLVRTRFSVTRKLQIREIQIHIG